MDNYILYVLNDINIPSNTNNNINQAISSSSPSNQTQLIPLIGKFSRVLIMYSKLFSFAYFFFDIVSFDTE